MKTAALLWYLAAQPGRDFSRSHLAALLWGERSEAQARNSLRTALVWLRQSIPDVLQTAADRVGFRLTPELSTDLSRALGLLQAPDADLEALLQLAGLWRGPFLDGLR